MQYYPTFLRLKGEKVVFSGAGDHAAAKIRLLLKTEAEVFVFGTHPSEIVLRWAEEGKINLATRRIEICDAIGARLVYGANDEPEEDQRAVALGKKLGALTNIVDNLQASEFLTPAIVDRDPVVIAIGTEGTAPVLARKIKSEIEELLPQSTGILARLADAFRPVAVRLKSSRTRRDFWKTFFFERGPKALAENGEQGAKAALAELFEEIKAAAPVRGRVDLIGAGPGDPELLTLKARRKLHEADVVLHDQLVTPEILELARREAAVINVGKKGYGPSWKQEDINVLLVKHAGEGKKVVRLKSGDPAIYGRLDEEIDALEKAEIHWEIIPGITTASAAAATMGTSLTRRGRNSSLRFLTGRDVEGFAEQDWSGLAKSGATAAIYMGVKASNFFAGRLLMHGANPETPMTIVENVSRVNQRTLITTVGGLPATTKHEGIFGPAIIFLGLTPRHLNAVDFTADELSILTGTGG